MRMRRLGRGQSIVFCVSEEIRVKIEALKRDIGPSDEIEILDVLSWVITETWRETAREIPLWTA
jgi:hypothetical protein